MNKHLTQGEIERYGSRDLSAAEAAKIIVHLAECPQCMEEYRVMFPDSTSIDQKFSLFFEQVDEREPFHLEFEEHFRRYVDNEIDDIDKEIVEGHITSCSYCAGMLRDLQEFSERLSLRSALETRSEPGFFARLYSAAIHRRFVLAFAILVMISAGAVAWYLLSNLGTREIATVSEPEITNTGRDGLAQNDSVDNSRVVVEAPREPEAKISIVPLKLPKFISSLRLEAPGTLRGENTAMPISVTSANGIAVRGAPRLSWRTVPGINAYDVSIFNENDDRIGGAEDLNAASWTPRNLVKGKIYKWQVTADKPEAEAVSYIGKGSFYLISSKEEARIDAASDPIEKGRALAEAGMFREASAEFQKIRESDPRSKIARAYLRQLESEVP